MGNFVELARKGFYDGLKFHRHVPGFVIQGGCPNTRDLTPEEVVKKAGNPFAGLGTGGPGYSIKEEFSTNPNNKHLDGSLAMARSQDPNSAGLAVLPVPGRPAHAGLRATRCSARRSTAWTSSASCA